MPRKKKTFVVDTNVLLYDHTAIYNFEEHDVVIPIVVLEELDKFKKGSDLINFEAREFVRQLDELSGDGLFNEGIPLGEGKGRLFVEMGGNGQEVVKHAFVENKPDHRILSLAVSLKESSPPRDVILISKDINLRMKAKSIGIPAEDYETGKVVNIEELYTGKRVFTGFSRELISRFYEEPHEIPAAEILPGEELVPNQYFIFKNRSASALGYYNPITDMIERVTKGNHFGIQPRNAEQTFALDALTRPEIQLVTLTGKAGTGKTLLALAAALSSRRKYHQIYLARPVVPLGNRDLGYLPGDVSEKLDPYMQPLFDNLAVIRHKYDQGSRQYQLIDQLLEQEKLTLAPLAYIRGRSLDNIFFIVDEAQNLTPHEVKTILTRAGEGAKIVFTGDIYQIDTPYLDSRSNGLTFVVDRMKGQELFGHMNLVKGERSELAELSSNLL